MAKQERLNTAISWKGQEDRKIAETIHLAIESDENFAYIVGYTSNGAPFGLTHEEFESIETDKRT